MKKRFVYLILVLLCSTACSKKDVFSNTTDPTLPVTQRLNTFIESKMKNIYLWADQARARKTDLNTDPEKFFYALVYSEEDPWSHIDQHYAEPTADIRGFDRQFGYYLQFYTTGFEEFAQICYVYPNTPADRAGLKRGDIIYKINGEFLGYFNRTDLYTSSSLDLQLASFTGQFNYPVLQLLPQRYHLEAEKTEVNPILVQKTLQIQHKKIGYMHYTEFMDNNQNSLNELSKAIRQFQQEKIDLFILDLRYNRGGYLTAARRLCSLLAPRIHVSQKDLLITKHWNAEYHKKMKVSNLEERFDQNVLADNLNLDQLYVITGTGTASASELLISGLKPYLNQLTLIGEKTVGKYVAAVTFQPDDPELNHWAIHPIVFSYLNARNESVKGGITPDIHQEENPFSLKALGDPEETLLQATLSLINGTFYQSRSAISTSPFRKVTLPEKISPSILISPEKIETGNK